MGCDDRFRFLVFFFSFFLSVMRNVSVIGLAGWLASWLCLSPGLL